MICSGMRSFHSLINYVIHNLHVILVSINAQQAQSIPCSSMLIAVFDTYDFNGRVYVMMKQFVYKYAYNMPCFRFISSCVYHLNFLEHMHLLSELYVGCKAWCDIEMEQNLTIFELNQSK